ncbi:MAG TPA: hypothetical protein PK511_12330 [Chitinophagales bacterium]|nr:hypothetical protein [Chitinophagales bacterium]HMZ88712.1 hypothetical protein [Chitinophagales bacterium]HNE47069.1 hypothetical protein [Chitinophagales bacterium]HNF69594.1 hypothetical protein [Chitinophagales bacterium]HNI55303.1 hypothetical protein [Chitinophagales bacterium]
MISVQNRRQPLSGNNKYIIVLLATVFLFASCGIFNGAQHDSTVSHPTNTDQTTVHADTVIRKKVDSVIIPTKVIDNLASEKKPAYDISFVLPFSIDAAELEKLSSEENITGFQPLASIEFYEGALMALDTLDSLGIKLNVHVFNNYKDSSLTAALFSKPEIMKSDAVFGPIFNESLKAASPVAQQNKFYLVSPLSPNNSFIDTNKYFMMANPTVEAQLEAMLKSIETQHPFANIINIYRSDKPNEKHLADDFAAAFNIANTGKGMRLSNATSYAEATALMKSVENFVFISSYDELYVNGLIRDLSKFSRETPVEMLGLQHILSFESISIDYYENLHFTYPNAYYIDRNSPKVINFETAFIERYSTRPSDFACRGYDFTLYIAMMLNSYGVDISASADKLNPATPFMLDPVRFTGIKNNAGITRYMEKSNITILRYDQYIFKPLSTN